MADFAPPAVSTASSDSAHQAANVAKGPPPPKLPEGWKAVWNDQYSEWFFVNGI